MQAVGSLALVQLDIRDSWREARNPILHIRIEIGAEQSSKFVCNVSVGMDIVLDAIRALLSPTDTVDMTRACGYMYPQV